MAKVWIANFAGHPYVPAEKFGELCYLTRGYVSLGNLERLVYDIVEKVADTDEEDFLLLSGLCIIGTVAATAWMLRHGRVKILHWDKKNTDYQLLEVKKGQIEKMYDIFLIRGAEAKWIAENE